MKRWQIQIVVITTAAAAWGVLTAFQAERQWLAGDSHIHSHWSADYDETKNPPEPIIGVDGRYATPINAHRARIYGLSWMVTTDHGGPNHSKLNLTRAYGELKASREMVPEVLQFYGMELNMPAMDHHTLIIPNSEREASMLYDIESRFDSQEAWPRDPSRKKEAHAEARAEYMKSLPLLPLMFANHPSRSATGIGVYGSNEPRELRANEQYARAGGVSRHGRGRPAIRRVRSRRTVRRSGMLPATQPEPRRLQPRRRTDVRRLRSDDGDRRRIVGLDARRRTPLLDCRDVGFARALHRRGAAGLGLLARRIPKNVRARPAQL